MSQRNDYHYFNNEYSTEVSHEKKLTFNYQLAAFDILKLFQH